MKKAKKIIALFLACVMLLSSGVLSASAADNVITVKMANFNVAGLPKFDGTDGNRNSEITADYFVDNGFDVVAVQEDFAYHKPLVNNLKGFGYVTNFSGSIPGGDGLNVFTKSMPIYNEKRVTWDKLFGDLVEGDTLTPKGIIYTVIEIADGVYVDFYNIHADAFDTEGSIEARESNYKQVMAMVEENSAKNNRPVIITGDFNHFLHTTAEVNSNMYKIFHEDGGLKDAWVEVHNDGNYFDFSEWTKSGTSYWGEWDSVEKFLYRDGGGVTVKPTDFNYTWVLNDEGVSVSDHASAECTFEFTVTEDFVPNTQPLNVVTQTFLRNLINTMIWIFKDLITVFSQLGSLGELLGI